MIPKYNLNSIGRLISLINEPNILNRLKNKSNFVPQIISYFQDYENMYIITTFYDGPSLNKIALNLLTEKQIQFISACLIIALKDMREQKIIHRDLTLGNIIMDKDYYFNLIDFSFSVDYSNRNKKIYKCNNDPKDTPPEILNNIENDYNSDYYRLGYIIFFLIFKKYPWEIKQLANITKLAVEHNLKGKYSFALLDFVMRLIKIDIKERLGYKSIFELINHSWFKDFNWKKIENKKIVSPFNNIKFIRNNISCKSFTKSDIMIKDYIKLTKHDYNIIFLKNFEF